MIISIVTITFNAEGLLQPTLDSVRQQTYPDVEHIIIDGASTDGTVGLARKYQQEQKAKGKGHEVIIVSEPDKGLYDAMNKGLKRTTGDYVLFLNAGDRLASPDTLQQVVDVAAMCADGKLPAVIYGDTDIIDKDGRFLGHRHLSVPNKLTWRSFRRGMLVCHQAFYVWGDIARKVPYDTTYRYSSDVDWCIRVMKQAHHLGLPLSRVSGVVALYLKEGETTRHHQDSLRERFAVMRKHYGLLSTATMHAWFVVRAFFRKLKTK